MKRYKTSISKRLFKYILLIVLAFALVVMVSNTLLLRPLYRFLCSAGFRAEPWQRFWRWIFRTMRPLGRLKLTEIKQGNTFEVLIYDDTTLIYTSNEESNWLGAQKGKHHAEIIERIREDGDEPDEVLDDVRQRGTAQDVLYQTGEKDGYTVIITQVMGRYRQHHCSDQFGCGFGHSCFFGSHFNLGFWALKKIHTPN